MQNKASDPLNFLLAIGLVVVIFFVFRLSGCLDSHPPANAEMAASSDSVPETPSEEALARAAMAKVVVDDFDIKIEDRYLYVRGSVINSSSRTVGYWKVTANFMNKQGKIIDSGFTNALETLLPGASKRFEIMHETLPGLADMRCYVEEVRLKD